jgi:flavin reductase (DIM6/NTAB) family NADH-FMN oxidoreductase RutF
MELNPDSVPWQSLYKILIGSVVPRPIGWISSMDTDGLPNLAPFSFFNVVCANPPTLLFCPTMRAGERGQKDTLSNVQVTGEFVVNIVTEELAEQMNLTAADVPADVNEFEWARLALAPALTVRPPRVAASPIHFECRVTGIHPVGAGPGSGSIVIGQILHLHIDERVLLGTDKIDVRQLKPVGRLAGNGYCRVTDLFEMVRPVL